MVYQAQPAPNIFDAQAKDFIDSVEEDFYICLHHFHNYWNSPFHTKDLSILKLLSIAECYLLTTGNSDTIVTPLDTKSIVAVVNSRLDKAPKYGSKARRYVDKLMCANNHRQADSIIGEGEFVEDSPDSGLTTNPNARKSRFL